MHYKACQGSWEEWIQDGLVRAGSRGMDDEDIVDKIFECEPLTGDSRGGTCPMNYRAWQGGFHGFISRLGVNVGRADPGWSVQAAKK